MKPIKKVLNQYAKELVEQYIKEQEDALNATPSSFNISSIIAAILSNKESVLQNIRSVKLNAIVSQGYSLPLRVQDNNKNTKDIFVNLEQILSHNAKGDLEVTESGSEPYTIIYDDINKAFVSADEARDFIRLFCLVINNYFGGFISAQQITIDPSIGFKEGFRSSDTIEFKSSFIWSTLLNKTNRWFRQLYSNQGINLQTQTSVSGKTNYYDLASLKTSIMFVFDNIQEIKSAMDIDFYVESSSKSSPYKTFATVMTHFMTAQAFDDLIRNKNFSPSHRIFTPPDKETYKTSLQRDFRGDAKSIKDKLINYISYLKYEILIYVRQYVIRAPRDSHLTEANETVVTKMLRQLQENASQQNTFSVILADINKVITDIGMTNTSSEIKETSYGPQRLERLVIDKEVIAQVEEFRDILNEPVLELYDDETEALVPVEDDTKESSVDSESKESNKEKEENTEE